jgi:hypothetical protein
MRHPISGSSFEPDNPPSQHVTGVVTTWPRISAFITNRLCYELSADGTTATATQIRESGLQQRVSLRTRTSNLLPPPTTRRQQPGSRYFACCSAVGSKEL